MQIDNLDKKFSLEDDDDAMNLNLSDNNYESFDFNHVTPRHHLMIPTTPPFSPGIRNGGLSVLVGNSIP